MTVTDLTHAHCARSEEFVLVVRELKSGGAGGWIEPFTQALFVPSGEAYEVGSEFEFEFRAL